MKTSLPLQLGHIAFAAPDAARAGASSSVLEIVSFKLIEDADEASFLKAAAGTETVLRDRGALVRRYLVRDANGTWTDVIEWTSMEAALTAAEAVMSHPDFAPFGALIDNDTVDMRHADIRWRME